MTTDRTYTFSLKHDDRFWILSQEAGSVYTQSLNAFWKHYNDTGVWLSKFELQAHMKDKIERKLLHSDSFLAAMQQVHNNLASWKEAKVVCPDAKAPYKEKFLQPIRFKQSQIHYKDGCLNLSLGTNEKGERDYFSFLWNTELPTTGYASISYDKTKGWKLNIVMSFDEDTLRLNKKKSLSLDLGVKRLATLFDGKDVITISGKKLRGLTHYQNKIKGDLNSKLSKKVKGSKRSRKMKTGWRKKNARLQNIKKDILHKASRFVVDYAIERRIGNIIIGDCASIHDGTNLGAKNNQQVQQNPEQQLKHYIEEKFNRISGGENTKIVPEPYTSQKCPCCENRHKPKNRLYECTNEKCGFVYDRDGVGAINIFNENVSFGVVKPGRIRLLTRPVGLKFSNSNQLLFAA